MTAHYCFPPRLTNRELLPLAAMRALCIILFTLLWSNNTSSAQQLQGSFTLAPTKHKVQLSSQSFVFANTRFAHVSAGCVSTSIDKGSFSCVGDTLLLHYDHWQQATSTFAARPMAADSSRGHALLRVLDATTKAQLPDIYITSRVPYGLDCATDSSGIARIALSASMPDTLLVCQTGYITAAVPMSAAAGHEVVVWLAPVSYRVPSGTTTKYLLSKRKAHSFALRMIEPAIPFTFYYQLATGEHAHWLSALLQKP